MWSCPQCNYSNDARFFACDKCDYRPPRNSQNTLEACANASAANSPSVERGAKLLSSKDVISGWGRLIEGVCVSPIDFYSKVESALAQRQIPKVEVSRVDWKEGGILSAEREYLRVKRERLVFDICGAPFGTGFFVSSRLAFVPLELGFVDYVFAAIVSVLFLAVGHVIGSLFWFGIAAICIALLLVVFMRHAAASGLADLDNALLALPFVNVFYERYFRRLTYFSVDSARMYQQAVHSAVLQVVDGILHQNEMRPLSADEKKPVLKELYRLEA